MIAKRTLLFFHSKSDSFFCFLNFLKNPFSFLFFVVFFVKKKTKSNSKKFWSDLFFFVQIRKEIDQMKQKITEKKEINKKKTWKQVLRTCLKKKITKNIWILNLRILKSFSKKKIVLWKSPLFFLSKNFWKQEIFKNEGFWKKLQK